jgi:hypothetical protein
MATRVLAIMPFADTVNFTNCPSKIMEKAEITKNRENEPTRMTNTRREFRNNFNE